MKNANESVAEDRENYLTGIEDHFVNALKIVGEGAMGIDLNSIRGTLFDELSMGLVCIKNLRELPEQEQSTEPAAQPTKEPSTRTHIRRDDDILADAFEAIGEVLSDLPFLNDGAETGSHCMENAVKCYSSLHILRPLVSQEKEQAS